MLTSEPDDPRVPVQLLVYAVLTGITTLTCIADFLAWTTVSSQTKTQLAGLYVPYLAICKLSLLLDAQKPANDPTAVFMGLDMTARLNARLVGSRPPPTVAAKKVN